jgi:hypothetical protein
MLGVLFLVLRWEVTPTACIDDKYLHRRQVSVLTTVSRLNSVFEKTIPKLEDFGLLLNIRSIAV